MLPFNNFKQHGWKYSRIKFERFYPVLDYKAGLICKALLTILRKFWQKATLVFPKYVILTGYLNHNLPDTPDAKFEDEIVGIF